MKEKIGLSGIVSEGTYSSVTATIYTSLPFSVPLIQSERVVIPNFIYYRGVSSKDFVFAWGNFISDFEGMVDVNVSLGEGCFNISGECFMELVVAYNGGGLVALNVLLTSNVTFYTYSKTIIDKGNGLSYMGDYTLEGKRLNNYFRHLDSSLDVVNEELMGRVDEWSNGQKDKYLDDISVMLRGMLDD